MNRLRNVLSSAQVIPVITIEDIDSALPLCQALIDGGLNVLEITLRSACAMDAIKEVKQTFPDAVIGAGTVTNANLFKQVEALNVDFAVSPGTTDALLSAAQDSACKLLPGVSSISDAMRARDAGFTELKLFPAEAVGGVALLKSIYGPLPDLSFCPTGGINLINKQSYLTLPNVLCVGGTWLTPQNAIEQQDWARIKELACAALQN